MSVEDLELKCYEYINSLRDTTDFVGSGQAVYGLDNERTRLHEELCRLSGLSKAQTFKFTYNIDLDRDENPARTLYFALSDERAKRQESDG